MTQTGVLVPPPRPQPQPKPKREINVFRPGPRDVRVAVTKDGQLLRVKYRPPRDPQKFKKTDEGESLATASLLATNNRKIGYSQLF